MLHAVQRGHRGVDCRAAAPGGALPPHTDLPRAAPDVSPAARTTHTFLLYVGDCNGGGETLLLEALPGDERLALAGGLPTLDDETEAEHLQTLKIGSFSEIIWHPGTGTPIRQNFRFLGNFV